MVRPATGTRRASDEPISGPPNVFFRAVKERRKDRAQGDSAVINDWSVNRVTGNEDQVTSYDPLRFTTDTKPAVSLLNKTLASKSVK